MLFQGILFSLSNLIFVLFLYSGLILMIISGTMNLEREEKVKGSIAFILIGAIPIVYQMISFQLYILTDDILPSGLDEYEIIIFIIPRIISIITFGILIMVLGKINIDNNGKRLLISGILWLIYAVNLLITSFGYIFPIPVPTTAAIILGIVNLALMLASRVFFLIYTTKIEDVILLVSSIALLVSTIATVTFDLILTFVP